MRPPCPVRGVAVRRRPGLTLAELVVSMAIMSIIFLGMAGAMMLATRAIPAGDGPAENVEDARETLGRLTEELRVAVEITERTATSITFTLNDRDGDGLPEVIRYSWIGAGSPLTRLHNGVATNVLEDVHQFDLGYELTDVAEEYPGPPVTSSEVELARALSDNVQDFRVTADDWIGQHLRPDLPADALSWDVTRVLFRAQHELPASGETRVQLRKADGDGEPVTTVLEEHTMWEILLFDSFRWTQFSFSDVTGLAPSETLCLVLEHQAGDPACVIEWDNHNGRGRLETHNAGLTWSNITDEVMPHYLYGRIVTPGTTQVLTRHHVSTVKIALRAGADTSGLVTTSVQTLNLPEALDGLWTADFNADPTLLDLDADGTPEWDVAGAFDPLYLSDGVWTANGELATNPADDFTRPVTVDLRFRDVTDDGEGGGIRLRVDRAATLHALVQAEVELDASGEQTLTILTYRGGLTPSEVLVVPRLSEDFVDLRLLVDPDADTCHVLVNGEDHGTFSYERVTYLASATCELFETANRNGLRFDSVRIRMGGTN